MTAPVLHFEPRPYTSPCALCRADIPLDQTVSLETADQQTVCDTCAQKIDPRQFAALAVLRAIDETWWAIARRSDATDPDAYISAQARIDATAYLRNVAAGVAMLVEDYSGATSATAGGAA